MSVTYLSIYGLGSRLSWTKEKKKKKKICIQSNKPLSVPAERGTGSVGTMFFPKV